MPNNEIPAAVWYEKAAHAIVRSERTLFQYANEANLGLTATECANIARTKEFQAALRAERNRFYKELSTDPQRNRNTAVGQMVFAIQKLLDAEQWDKAVAALTQLFKAEGWTSEATQLTIFNDLNAKDIDGLREKLRKRNDLSAPAKPAVGTKTLK
jgi:hypothetical protein